jgi:hypothetical protein
MRIERRASHGSAEQLGCMPLRRREDHLARESNPTAPVIILFGTLGILAVCLIAFAFDDLLWQGAL